MTGAILMITGILLMFVIVTLPVITEMMSGNIFSNLIIGTTLLMLDFGIFTNQLKIPKRQKKEKTYQKSKHRFIEVFGLE